MIDSPEYIYVMANPRTTRLDTANGVFVPLVPGQCALLEEDEEHPFDPKAGVHRAFVVAGRPPVLAAQTAQVQQRLLEKQIIIVQKAQAETMIAEFDAKRKAAYADATAKPTDDQIYEDEYAAAVSSRQPSKRASRASRQVGEQATSIEDNE